MTEIIDIGHPIGTMPQRSDERTGSVMMFGMEIPSAQDGSRADRIPGSPHSNATEYRLLSVGIASNFGTVFVDGSSSAGFLERARHPT